MLKVTNHVPSYAIKNKKENVLKVCSELSFLPLEMKSKSGVAYGYEIDILNAFAKRYDYQIVYVEIPWTAAVPALAAKKCDLIASGFSPSEERNKLVNFTDSTYEIVDQFVLKKKTQDRYKFKDIQDFDQKGITVGVRQANETDIFLRKYFKHAKVLQFPNSDSDVISALLDDKVTAIALHSPTAATVLAANKDKLVVLEKPIPVKTFHVAYAVRKDNTGDILKEKFYVFFSEFKKTGEFQAIYRKYF